MLQHHYDLRHLNTPRNAIIDTFRGMSVLFVILLHLYINLPFSNSLPGPIVNVIFRSGYFAVIIFFVISGFLISNSIIEKWGSLSDVKPLEFYRLRFARIIPFLVALVLVSSILHLHSIPGFVIQTTTLPRAIFAALTFHINWLEAQTGFLPANWDVLWSLSVEEVFYLFFPLLCLISNHRRLFIGILLLFIIVGPIARTTGPTAYDEMWRDHSYLSCMDGMAFGVLAAFISVQCKNLNTKMIQITGLMLFVISFFLRGYLFKLGLSKIGLNVTLLELSMALILLGFKHSNASGVNFLRWYGRNSYEVYLTHSFVIIMLASIFKNITFPAVLLLYLFAIVVCGFVGQICAKYYSIPCNRWIRNS